MKLIRIGDRIINIEAITHASFDPVRMIPGINAPWAECCLSFGNDDCCILYGPEAVRMWGFLADYSGDITPQTRPEDLPY